jgi:hypothetical protein
LRKSFDEVWKDIQTVLSNKTSVNTLVRKVKNDVISLEKDHIKLKSENTGKIRKVPRSQFENVWDSLADKGLYISRNHEPYIHSQIICAIPALLKDYIEVRYNPLTLYLKSSTKQK